MRTPVILWKNAYISRSEIGVTLTLKHKKECEHVSIVYECQSHTFFRSANVRIQLKQ